MNKLKNALYLMVRVAVTLVILAVALLAGRRLWLHYEVEPWTRDGRIRVDVTQIAPDVGGLVTDVEAHNDQVVKRGQPLFTVDRARYALALQQADGAVAAAKAAVGSDEAALVGHQATINGAEVALSQAKREAARSATLGQLVAKEALEEARAKVDQDTAVLAQANAALIQAKAVLAQANAALTQAQTARDLAALNLQRTTVIAPNDGILSDVAVQVGDYIAPGKPVLALIDTSTFRVEGYFEETKLPSLHIGDAVTIALMGEQEPLHGHIQSIAGAIADRERLPDAELLPNVNPTFSWVRLAQRVPVRIVLDQVPANIRLIAGRTASVSVVGHGPEPSWLPQDFRL